jgi:hypothetical protein
MTPQEFMVKLATSGFFRSGASVLDTVAVNDDRQAHGNQRQLNQLNGQWLGQPV